MRLVLPSVVVTGAGPIDPDAPATACPRWMRRSICWKPPLAPTPRAAAAAGVAQA